MDKYGTVNAKNSILNPTIIIINASLLLLLFSASHTVELRELTVLHENYSSFCNTLTDFNHLLAYFVDRGIIITDVLEEIQNTTRNPDKVGLLLRNIVYQLRAQYTDGFYYMLDIMKVHGLMSTQELASEILRQLSPSHMPSVEPEGKSNT